MKIAVFEQPEEKSLGQGPEVWVQVRSNELLDWPRIKARLDKNQTAVLGRCGDRPVAYHPALCEGGDDNQYLYEDWFIFKPRSH